MTLKFDGVKICDHGYEGRFRLTKVVVYMYNNANIYGWSTITYATNPYALDDFDDCTVRRLKVVDVYPQDGTGNVPLDTTIWARFNSDVEDTSLPSNFTVSGVSGTITYDPNTFTATFIPYSLLNPGEVYTAKVDTGVVPVDPSILPMNVVKLWSFETGIPPEVDAVDANGNTKSEFDLYETFYVNGRFLLPSTHYTLYVVPDTILFGDNLESAHVAQGPGNLTTDTNGNFFMQPVWYEPDVAGSYLIVVSLDATYDQQDCSTEDSVIVIDIPRPEIYAATATGHITNRIDAETPLHVFGSGFEPNETVRLYVVDVQYQWTQDDALVDNTGRAELVTADANGNIPPTEIWHAADVGTFDVVADRNNHGEYDEYDAVDDPALVGVTVTYGAPAGHRELEIACEGGPSLKYKNVFVPNDAVYATINPNDNPGLVYQYVDIYVLEDKNAWNTGDALTDVSGGYEIHIVQPGCWNANFVLIAPAASLPLGDYEVIVDVNRDGQYEERIDIIDRAAKVGFEVRDVCTDPPTIEVTSPPVEGAPFPPPGECYDITWEASAPCGNAQISLYYDNNRTGYDGTEIISGLPGSSGSYEWCIPPELPRVTYYIYAEIKDDKNPPVYSYSPGALVPLCVKGDANGDGDVDALDVTMAEKICVGSASLPAGCSEDLIEVTCDGIFNSLDVTGIEILIVYGEFPCPTVAPPYPVQSAQLDIAYTLLSDKKTFVVTLNATGIDNLDIASFTLQFDKKALRLVDVTAGTLTASGTPLVHTNNAGVTNVLINLPGNADISGDGSLMQMKFEMIDEPEHSQQIKLSELLLGDSFARSIPVNAKDFQFNFPQIPRTSQLLQNYPNPFNPETWIPYKLANASDVVIKIYNVSGQTIRTLHLGHKDAGVYLTREQSAYWDGKNDAGETVASGIYFYSIQAGKFAAVKRMVVVR